MWSLEKRLCASHKCGDAGCFFFIFLLELNMMTKFITWKRWEGYDVSTTSQINFLIFVLSESETKWNNFFLPFIPFLHWPTHHINSLPSISPTFLGMYPYSRVLTPCPDRSIATRFVHTTIIISSTTNKNGCLPIKAFPILLSLLIITCLRYCIAVQFPWQYQMYWIKNI